MDRADRSTATVRTASRMARRMAGGRASVNDIRASFQPVRDIGEGQCSRGSQSSRVSPSDLRPRVPTDSRRRKMRQPYGEPNRS